MLSLSADFSKQKEKLETADSRLLKVSSITVLEGKQFGCGPHSDFYS